MTTETIEDRLRPECGNLDAEGLNEQQIAIDEQQELQQARDQARRLYGVFFEIIGANGVEFHPSQNCDRDRVRS